LAVKSMAKVESPTIINILLARVKASLPEEKGLQENKEKQKEGLTRINMNAKRDSD